MPHRTFLITSFLIIKLLRFFLTPFNITVIDCKSVLGTVFYWYRERGFNKKYLQEFWNRNFNCSHISLLTCCEAQGHRGKGSSYGNKRKLSFHICASLYCKSSSIHTRGTVQPNDPASKALNIKVPFFSIIRMNECYDCACRLDWGFAILDWCWPSSFLFFNFYFCREKKICSYTHSSKLCRGVDFKRLLHRQQNDDAVSAVIILWVMHINARC